MPLHCKKTVTFQDVPGGVHGRRVIRQRGTQAPDCPVSMACWNQAGICPLK